MPQVARGCDGTAVAGIEDIVMIHVEPSLFSHKRLFYLKMTGLLVSISLTMGVGCGRPAQQTPVVQEKQRRIEGT